MDMGDFHLTVISNFTEVCTDPTVCTDARSRWALPIIFENSD
jgi:hypothetical protein